MKSCLSGRHPQLTYATRMEVCRQQSSYAIVCRSLVVIGRKAAYAYRPCSYDGVPPWEHVITRTILENHLQMQAIRYLAQEQP